MESEDHYMDVLSRLISSALHSVVLHPVTFELVWDESPELDSATLESADLTLFELIEDKGWDAVVLPKRHLTIFSKKAGNKDIRGGGCGDHEFPVKEFFWEVSNPTGITFRNLVEGVYRMKGSKYDLWYEMFCCIKLEKEDETGYIIETVLDYGS